MTLSDCFALFVKFFFLLTPPFVMSAFLSVTKDNTIQERNTLAIWITLWILIISGVLLFFGGFIFKIFGITLDAFRIGTGALLFLTAVSLVRGDSIRVPSGRLRPVFSSCADGHSDHFGAGLYRCADGLRR